MKLTLNESIAERLIENNKWKIYRDRIIIKTAYSISASTRVDTTLGIMHYKVSVALPV
jgi:hypothetical protein